MIPGLAARRWDMINTGMFYTEERAKLMYLVRYEEQAISISVPRGNPRKITQVRGPGGPDRRRRAGRLRVPPHPGHRQGAGGEGAEAHHHPALRQFRGRASRRCGSASSTPRSRSTARAKEYDERGDFTRALSGLFGTPINFGLRSKVLAQAVAVVLGEMKADGSFGALLDKYGVKAYDGPFDVVGPS